MRSDALSLAQKKAKALFQRIADLAIVRPGVWEKEAESAIYALAEKEFGVSVHWHKRIVRCGKNTLAIFSENPPNLQIAPDDLVFLDLGPVFEEWEADLGRTFVMGNDPEKHRLTDDLEHVFHCVKTHFSQRASISGAELYAFAEKEATQRRWALGNTHAGHLIGEFPHQRVPGEKAFSYITRANTTNMRELDALGRVRHWILEVHLVHKERGFGGFYEELLTVD